MSDYDALNAWEVLVLHDIIKAINEGATVRCLLPDGRTVTGTARYLTSERDIRDESLAVTATVGTEDIAVRDILQSAREGGFNSGRGQ